MTGRHALVHRVVAEGPALEPLLSEHLDDMDGELLPHLLFYDFTRWAQAQPLDSEDLSRFLAVLEDAYAGQDMDQREVIYVSFLENLDPSSPVFDLLGQRLAGDARDFRAWPPESGQ